MYNVVLINFNEIKTPVHETLAPLINQHGLLHKYYSLIQYK